MTTFGICMVKDELDVIGGTVSHMADEVDHLIVADNGSADGTRDVLAELTDQLPLTVIDDPDPAYYQSRKMTALADLAADRGAEWIVPFDADELWYGNDRISTVLAAVGDRCTIANARLFNHFPTAIDPAEADPFKQIIWRQTQPGALPKVAFRWEPGAIVHQGNHGVTLPNGGLSVDVLELRHFPYRSVDQFVRKARNGADAYRHTDLPQNQGAHWRAYGEILDRFGEDGLAGVFREHFWFFSPTDSGLINDPAPYMRWRA